MESSMSRQGSLRRRRHGKRVKRWRKSAPRLSKTLTSSLYLLRLLGNARHALERVGRVAHHCRTYGIPYVRLPDILRALWVEDIVSQQGAVVNRLSTVSNHLASACNRSVSWQCSAIPLT